MTSKLNKTLSLSLSVAKRLEEEENQSKTVEEALQEYWGDANAE